ncbi:MAG: hypothetical protein JXR22_09520, partial [Prolixibacteraceae bacterium]|nr:hypothetical protein [Prolixibacteraceae bacterium]
MVKLRSTILFLLLTGLLSCSDTRQAERLFAHFLDRHVERIKPINKKYNEAVWATYTGKSTFGELYDNARITDSLFKVMSEPIEYYQGLLHNVYDNASEVELLLKIKQSGLINDTLLKREFVNVFRNYIMNQNNWNESNAIKTALFESFFELKKTETAFWDSAKSSSGNQPGREWIKRFASLTDQFRNMVVTMNHEVKQLGYDNYYQCILDFHGVDYASLDDFCELIEKETEADYRVLLQLCREDVCRRYQIAPEAINPEHYRVCNEAMVVPEPWQKEYTQDEMLGILRNYFALGNFAIDDIIGNSEIWYDPDKVNQSFFFSADIEKGDHRIYANIRPNTRGVHVMLHEFAHAVHYKYVDPKLPYLLKEPHLVTLEGLGIYFNNKLYSSEKLRKMMGIEQEAGNPYFDEFSCPS